jgi:hypothetical protein
MASATPLLDLSRPGGIRMQRAAKSQSREALIGSWRLLSFELQSPDGSISHPFGKSVSGYLFYNEQGFMSAAFMGVDRAHPDSDDLAEVAKGVNFDAFNAYTGPFEVKEDRIYHYVEVSSLPQWKGTTQERIFNIDGDRLVIETVPLQIAEQSPVGLLIWERA